MFVNDYLHARIARLFELYSNCFHVGVFCLSKRNSSTQIADKEQQSTFDQHRLTSCNKVEQSQKQNISGERFERKMKHAVLLSDPPPNHPCQKWYIFSMKNLASPYLKGTQNIQKGDLIFSNNGNERGPNGGL